MRFFIVLSLFGVFASACPIMDINRQFHSETGIAVRLIGLLPSLCDDHSCEPWKLDHANSFAIYSNVSWSKKDQRYSVFPGLGNLSRVGGWPGFIATKEAADTMIDCQFPGDGATGCRGPADGLPQCGAFSMLGPARSDMCPNITGVQPGGTDWCDIMPHTSYFCAYRKNETADMLKEFKQRGGGDAGKGFTPYYGYNEAALNREKWDAALPANIWAFVIGDACRADPLCYGSFTFWYGDFKKKYGEKLVVGFSGENRENPYHAIPQPKNEVMVV